METILNPLTVAIVSVILDLYAKAPTKENTMSATQTLSRAQESTLREIGRRGGEVNDFARQRGIYSHSYPVLIRLGLLECLGYCACTADKPCDRTHTVLEGQAGGEQFWNRHRLTDAGRAWLAENPPTS